MGTRDELKRIAMDTAQKSGLRTLTLRDLGQAAGIKSSSVAYHFGSKDALLQEITEDYARGVTGVLDRLEQSEDSPAKRLLGFMELLEDTQHQQKLCLCGILAANLDELDPPTREVVRGFFEELESWMARQLLAVEGLSLSKASALSRARVLMAALEGALFLDKAEGGSSHLAATRQWLESIID